MTLPLIGTLNTLDLILIGASIFFIGLGAWKGLVKTLFQAASWIAGAAGGYLGWTHFAPELQANVAHVPSFGLSIIAGIVGFLACFIAVRLIGSMLDKFISSSGLSGLNRWGGALIGLIKAFVLAGIVLFTLQVLPIKGDLLHTRESSKCYRLWKTLAIPGLPKGIALPIQ